MATGLSLADDELKVVVALSGNGGACGRLYAPARAVLVGLALEGVVAARACPAEGESAVCAATA